VYSYSSPESLSPVVWSVQDVVYWHRKFTSLGVFGGFLGEELAAPLGMDNTYVGLPAGLEGRVSPKHLMEDDADTSGYSGIFSEPTVLRSVVPGANGVATGGDLVRFYAMMERKGSLDSATVIQSATLEEAVEFQVEGVDRFTGSFAHRSLGLALADERVGKSTGDPLNTFGRGGAGTSIGWADFDSGLAVGYITNGFQGSVTNNARLAAISQAVRDACTKHGQPPSLAGNAVSGITPCYLTFLAVQ